MRSCYQRLHRASLMRSRRSWRRCRRTLSGSRVPSKRCRRSSSKRLQPPPVEFAGGETPAKSILVQRRRRIHGSPSRLLDVGFSAIFAATSWHRRRQQPWLSGLQRGTAVSRIRSRSWSSWWLALEGSRAVCRAGSSRRGTALLQQGSASGERGGYPCLKQCGCHVQSRRLALEA